MKYKFPIIGGISVAFVIVLITTLTMSQPSPNNSELNEFTEIMTVTFEPSEIKGLNRDYESEPTKFTDQDLESVPKVKQMLDYALSASMMPQIQESISYVEDDPPSRYVISQPGPFTYKSESYLTTKELNQYHLWVDKNLISIPIYQEPSMHYLEYKGEVFRLSFVPIS